MRSITKSNYIGEQYKRKDELLTKAMLAIDDDEVITSERQIIQVSPMHISNILSKNNPK